MGKDATRIRRRERGDAEASRRAFDAAGAEGCDRDFADLLGRLN